MAAQILLDSDNLTTEIKIRLNYTCCSWSSLPFGRISELAKCYAETINSELSAFSTVTFHVLFWIMKT